MLSSPSYVRQKETHRAIELLGLLGNTGVDYTGTVLYRHHIPLFPANRQ